MLCGKCQEYYGHPAFGGLCSNCSGAHRAPVNTWALERDEFMATHGFYNNRNFTEARKFLRRGRVAEFCTLMYHESLSGRFLSFEEAKMLFFENPEMSEYNRVHAIFPFVLDRWRICEVKGIPHYSVCYYGPELPCCETKEASIKSVQTVMGVAHPQRTFSTALEEARKMLNE